ncbi:hypothetical protein Avbf_18662 [Armadillidium vulgare]|nr:hypothetical protein Avbf_18662 [Armadillidium vulgare]
MVNALVWCKSSHINHFILVVGVLIVTKLFLALSRQSVVDTIMTKPLPCGLQIALQKIKYAATLNVSKMSRFVPSHYILEQNVQR